MLPHYPLILAPSHQFPSHILPLPSSPPPLLTTFSPPCPIIPFTSLSSYFHPSSPTSYSYIFPPSPPPPIPFTPLPLFTPLFSYLLSLPLPSLSTSPHPSPIIPFTSPALPHLPLPPPLTLYRTHRSSQHAVFYTTPVIGFSPIPVSVENRLETGPLEVVVGGEAV